MPSGLKRYQQSKHFHFITLSCYKRQPFFRTAAAKDTVLQILEQTRRQQGLSIVASVLMREHVPLLTDEPATDTPSPPACQSSSLPVMRPVERESV